MYVPAQIELGKRPKLEYQIVAAFHAQVLATVQAAEPDTAGYCCANRLCGKFGSGASDAAHS